MNLNNVRLIHHRFFIIYKNEQHLSLLFKFLIKVRRVHEYDCDYNKTATLNFQSIKLYAARVDIICDKNVMRPP